MKEKESIVYMGTPEFAVAPLKKLIDNEFHVAAVVTVPDKPAGRGLKVHKSAVKQFAETHNIPVLQPEKLSDPSFLDELEKYHGNLFIVVAFRKLPERVWSMPLLGCFNLHASLLPQYRGAAPINHAVINGETETGVTTFFLNNQIDTGKIIMQRRLEIGRDETAGELHDRLMDLGSEVVLETTRLILHNNYTLTDQSKLYKREQSAISINGLSVQSEKLKPAPKIFRNDCKINWDQEATVVHNFIRGLSPYPGAFSIISTSEGQREIKVLKTALSNKTSSTNPGTIIIDGQQLFVSCRDRLLEVLNIQPSGKKPMDISDFLRGNRAILENFH